MDRGIAQKPTAVDLFAGAGGCTLGLRKAGFHVLAAFDIDASKAKTLLRNHPGTRVLGLSGNDGDVRHLRPNLLRKIAGMDDRGLDLMVACPPCQGFSMQGNRDPNDQRNSLYLEFLRLVSNILPRTIAFENVPGLLSSQDGRVYGEIVVDLEKIGYSTSTWILNASDYGVPQSRKRLFLVGVLSGSLPRIPQVVEPQRTVWESIADLPTRRPSEVDGGRSIGVKYRGIPRSAYAKELRGSRSRVANCETTTHSPTMIKRMSDLRWGERDDATWQRRLHPHKPSPTLTAGTKTRTACRPIHPFACRVLTVREGARLSSFPDWYRFPAQKAEAWSQIGNAVPPLMAEAVFRQLRRCLDTRTPMT